MNKKTLIFTDLDGSLLDHYSYQTEPAEETLAILKFHEMAIIPNSSKTFTEQVLIRKQLQLTSPFIVENGAAVYIPVDYFTEQPVDSELQGEFWVKSFSQDKSHWLTLLNEVADDFKDCFQLISQLSVQQLADLTGLTVEQSRLAQQRQYGQPLNWCGSETEQVKFIERMAELGAHILIGGRFMHVSGDCDKGRAQRWLVEQYKRHYPERGVLSVALGDSANDNAMLEEADLALQIRSPVHDFPQLLRQQGVYQSQHYGPTGWAESLHKMVLANLDS